VIQIDPKGNKLHTAFYNEFLLYLAILVPEINISRTATLEFQDFSRVFQDLYLFPGLSRPGNLNTLIPGLSRYCTNPVVPCTLYRTSGRPVSDEVSPLSSVLEQSYPHLYHPTILCLMPFLQQPSQFILTWDMHQVCWLVYPVAWLHE